MLGNAKESLSFCSQSWEDHCSGLRSPSRHADTSSHQVSCCASWSCLCSCTSPVRYIFLWIFAMVLSCIFPENLWDESLKRPGKHCFCFYIHCGFVGLANDGLIFNSIGILDGNTYRYCMLWCTVSLIIITEYSLG